MQICVDLHSHSGYAGGVGDIRFPDIANTMSCKGIDVFGTGDCLFPKRSLELRNELLFEHNQLYSLKSADRQFFLLQTEVIFSVRLAGYKQKIVAHHVILFPDFESIYHMDRLMNRWGQKNTIGRPFIVCAEQNQLEDRLFQIQAIHPLLEIIPAHILTPDGIMGSKNMLTAMDEFYGGFMPHIHALETGLSADPAMLSKLEGINTLSMLSFSDCHSAALNRVGREFTALECDELSYQSIINSIRQKKINYTAEFNPAEGRYYLTGHRAGKNNHETDLFFNADYPESLICPVCGKKLTMGVKDRCNMLKHHPLTPQKFIRQIPLIDVLAYACGLKSVSSPRLLSLYYGIIKHFETETALWSSPEETIKARLNPAYSSRIVSAILAVRSEKFSYNPPGFDGVYGHLQIECENELSSH